MSYVDKLLEIIHSWHKINVDLKKANNRETEQNSNVKSKLERKLKQCMDKFDIELKRLMQKKLNLNIQGKEGYPPLHSASAVGCYDMVVALVKAGADPNESLGIDGSTPLYIATQQGEVQIARFLIENKAAINFGIHECPPLCIAASLGDEQMVRLLLESGANVNGNGNSEGQGIPLIVASKSGALGVIKLLIAHKVNELVSFSGRSPLSIAASFGQLEVVKYFVEELHYDVNGRLATEMTPLEAAGRTDQVAVMKYFIEEKKANINVICSDGLPLICSLASLGHLEPVKLLVANGVDVDTEDKNKETALSKAASNGHDGVVQFLLEKNAKVAPVLLGNEQSALSKAAANGDAGLVHQLLVALYANGFTREVINNAAYAGIKAAAESGYGNIVRMFVDIKKASAKQSNSSKVHGSDKNPLKVAAKTQEKMILGALNQSTSMNISDLALRRSQLSLSELMIVNLLAAGIPLNQLGQMPERIFDTMTRYEASSDIFRLTTSILASRNIPVVVDINQKIRLRELIVIIFSWYINTAKSPSVEMAESMALDTLLDACFHETVTKQGSEDVLGVYSPQNQREIYNLLVDECSTNKRSKYILEVAGILIAAFLTDIHIFLSPLEKRLRKLDLQEESVADWSNFVVKLEKYRKCINFATVVLSVSRVLPEYSDVLRGLYDKYLQSSNQIYAAITLIRRMLHESNIKPTAVVKQQLGEMYVNGRLDVLTESIRQRKYMQAINLVDEFTPDELSRTDSKGWTPLCLAAVMNDIPVATKLLQAKVKVDQAITRSADATDLIIDDLDNQSNLTKILWANRITPSPNGLTAAYLAGISGHGAMLTLLVEAKANIDALGPNDETLLVKAVRNNNIALTRQLIGLNADVNARSKNNMPVLYMAVQSNFIDIVADILAKNEAIVDAEYKKMTPLCVAASNGSHVLVDMLIKHGACADGKFDKEFTPLASAALRAQTLVIERLIKAKVNVDRVFGDDKFTALHAAANAGHCEAVQVLLKANASTDIASKQGATALQMAAIENRDQVVAVFINPDTSIDAIKLLDYSRADFKLIKKLAVAGVSCTELRAFADIVFSDNKTDPNTYSDELLIRVNDLFTNGKSAFIEKFFEFAVHMKFLLSTIGRWKQVWHAKFVNAKTASQFNELVKELEESNVLLALRGDAKNKTDSMKAPSRSESEKYGHTKLGEVAINVLMALFTQMYDSIKTLVLNMNVPLIHSLDEDESVDFEHALSFYEALLTTCNDQLRVIIEIGSYGDDEKARIVAYKDAVTLAIRTLRSEFAASEFLREKSALANTKTITKKTAAGKKNSNTSKSKPQQVNHKRGEVTVVQTRKNKPTSKDASNNAVNKLSTPSAEAEVVRTDLDKLKEQYDELNTQAELAKQLIADKEQQLSLLLSRLADLEYEKSKLAATLSLEQAAKQNALQTLAELRKENDYKSRVLANQRSMYAELEKLRRAVEAELKKANQTIEEMRKASAPATTSMPNPPAQMAKVPEPDKSGSDTANKLNLLEDSRQKLIEENMKLRRQIRTLKRQETTPPQYSLSPSSPTVFKKAELPEKTLARLNHQYGEATHIDDDTKRIEKLKTISSHLLNLANRTSEQLVHIQVRKLNAEIEAELSELDDGDNNNSHVRLSLRYRNDILCYYAVKNDTAALLKELELFATMKSQADDCGFYKTVVTASDAPKSDDVILSDAVAEKRQAFLNYNAENLDALSTRLSLWAATRVKPIDMTPVRINIQLGEIEVCKYSLPDAFKAKELHLEKASMHYFEALIALTTHRATCADTELSEIDNQIMQAYRGLRAVEKLKVANQQIQASSTRVPPATPKRMMSI